jgi:hypothetical protein
VADGRRKQRYSVTNAPKVSSSGGPLGTITPAPQRDGVLGSTHHGAQAFLVGHVAPGIGEVRAQGVFHHPGVRDQARPTVLTAEPTPAVFTSFSLFHQSISPVEPYNPVVTVGVRRPSLAERGRTRPGGCDARSLQFGANAGRD